MELGLSTMGNLSLRSWQGCGSLIDLEDHRSKLFLAQILSLVSHRDNLHHKFFRLHNYIRPMQPSSCFVDSESGGKW
jgi:hypothetical protein